MDEIPEEIWREGVGGRGEELGKVFGRCFNGRVSHCSKGLGRKEQLALVTPTVVVELTRKMLSTLRGGEEGKERERGGGWVGVNGLRKRRRNTIITSPQIYEDREIEIFVPRQARRRQAAARPPRAVQNIFNYGIIICCLCRGECAPLLPAQIILI